MSKAKFSIICVGDDVFEFYEDGQLQFKFKRETFRTSFEDYADATGRSSKWVGTLLRIFLQKFPPPITPFIRTPFETALDRLHEKGFVDYLRSKGFRVTQRIEGVSDLEIISYLESQGYVVEGLLKDSFYSTDLNTKVICN